mmetsp:Transcript_40786/g.103887  ORF Transcript_40786/g.103887 Transcript_40786/m.103887 type:complete len:205 (-) Transcript_40786:124-738(-)
MRLSSEPSSPSGCAPLNALASGGPRSSARPKTSGPSSRRVSPVVRRGRCDVLATSPRRVSSPRTSLKFTGPPTCASIATSASTLAPRLRRLAKSCPRSKRLAFARSADRSAPFFSSPFVCSGAAAALGGACVNWRSSPSPPVLAPLPSNDRTVFGITAIGGGLMIAKAMFQARSCGEPLNHSLSGLTVYSYSTNEPYNPKYSKT